jgi:hypothetical protein
MPRLTPQPYVDRDTNTENERVRVELAEMRESREVVWAV